MDSKIIKALKENEFRYGDLNPELQAAFRELKAKDLEFSAGWEAVVNIDYRPQDEDVLRLRADYSEKPEIVECEIVREGGVGILVYKRRKDSIISPLHEAQDHPNFIGFKYEGNRISILPRIYANENLYEDLIKADTLDKYEVLTPTHVLFQKATK